MHTNYNYCSFSRYIFNTADIKVSILAHRSVFPDVQSLIMHYGVTATNWQGMSRGDPVGSF